MFFFFLAKRPRSKCCCGCVALIPRHIRPPLPVVSHHTTMFRVVVLRLVLWPPPPPLQVSHAGPDIRRSRLFESVQHKLTVWKNNQTWILSTSNVFGVSIRTERGLKWAPTRVTACFQMSVYSQLISRAFRFCDESLSELRLNQQNSLATPSELCRQLRFPDEKDEQYSEFQGLDPKGWFEITFIFR